MRERWREGYSIYAGKFPLRPMTKAFVLMNVDVGTDREVVNGLKSMEHVTKVYEVYGVYDIVAEVEGDTLEDLKETVNTKIRRLANVRSTNTMIVVP
jgi:DNA-binding Lrp family transcriptional regulator